MPALWQTDSRTGAVEGGQAHGNQPVLRAVMHALAARADHSSERGNNRIALAYSQGHRLGATGTAVHCVRQGRGAEEA